MLLKMKFFDYLPKKEVQPNTSRIHHRLIEDQPITKKTQVNRSDQINKKQIKHEPKSTNQESNQHKLSIDASIKNQNTKSEKKNHKMGLPQF